MIPIGDENRNRRFPLIVVALIAINVLVFGYQLSLNTQPNQATCDVAVSATRVEAGGPLECFIYRYSVRPYEVSNNVDVPPTIRFPILLTALTSMFMHGGWLHIIGNMLFLWVFGDNVEDRLGRFKFLLFYLLSGAGAVALQVAVDRNSFVPMVGASGAIAGVLAAYLVLFPGIRVRTLVFLGVFVTIIRLPALVVIGVWVLLQFLAGYASLGPQTEVSSGGVAYFAHIGGFLTGLALIFILGGRRLRGWGR